MNDLLQQAYDPNTFRRQGHELVDRLADFLEQALDDRDARALRWQAPDTHYQNWKRDAGRAVGNDPLHLFEEVLAASIHLQNPRYMGHQISPPAPVAALAGLLGDFLNNGMGVYEMGAPATAIERLVTEAVAGRLGMGADAGGVLTSGGSLANLTALLAARSVKGDGVWRQGHRQRLALMVSEEAHYCVDRAVRIMAWGEEGIIKVPVDERLQMRTELLPACLAQAREAGLQVIAVVGSACTTSTGSFDDLNAIADFCAANELWFHIDGAHGGALAFSGAYRSVVSGIERADSLALDFHKMLLTPSVTTALLFREGRHAYATFAQQGQYLWSKDEETEWYNLAKRTFECTKLMLSVKVYSILRTYGWELFDQYVTRVCRLGERFGVLIDAAPGLELATDPTCNIVCFRYRPPGMTEEETDVVNQAIRRTLLEEGRFYIVQTRLRNHNWLRCTLTNPFTTEAHLKELLEAVTIAGNTEEHLSTRQQTRRNRKTE